MDIKEEVRNIIEEYHIDQEEKDYRSLTNFLWLF